MPLNSSPVTASVQALAEKRSSATGQLSVDIGFHGGVVPGNIGSIVELLDAGVLGIKAFLCHSGIDAFPHVGERELRQVMPLLAARGIPVLAHAEIASAISPLQNPRRYADSELLIWDCFVKACWRRYVQQGKGLRKCARKGVRLEMGK